MSCVLLVAVAACDRQAQPAIAAPPASCQPLPGASASSSEPLNSTALTAEPLLSPSSKASLRFTAPQLAEEISLPDPRKFQVEWASDFADTDALGIDIALDTGRPRRLPQTRSAILLGELCAVDAELAPGAHWLFAAPVSASGLVPRLAPGMPRAAIARRFFVGKAPRGEVGPSGAVWLRKPEGTYNGLQNAESVLFDAFVFSAAGTPLDATCTIGLRAPGVTGALRLPAPFSVQDMPNGDYDVDVSAPSARPVTSRFIVNRELGGPP